MIAVSVDDARWEGGDGRNGRLLTTATALAPPQQLPQVSSLPRSGLNDRPEQLYGVRYVALLLQHTTVFAGS